MRRGCRCVFATSVATGKAPVARRAGGVVEEEDIVLGAQALGRGLKVLALVALAALLAGGWWFYRRLS